MDYLAINRILHSVTGADPKKIINRTFKVRGLSLLMIRDVLFRIGNSTYEDIERCIYISSIKGGVLKQNSAWVLFELRDDTLNLAAYAKEGLISQHTAEGVIYGIEKEFEQYICKD